MADQLAGTMLDRFAGELVQLLTCLLVNWYDAMADLLASELVQLRDQSAGELVNWLTSKLVNWYNGWSVS